ncbi:hypothetical protein [Stenotrophomonas sp. MMGLT7]|uniref:hypothetical protein n=1 Tax=Stenotrophomonas sp. MMGLT7 TaxID=2901227 RepID=UPI001E601D5D|nr:hypothetical protein [Stenotrophomonas sp. MMGLT7]MCD7099869.1 hypothetical protein [Stenotrophomonas sp. MMGLT7]
MGAAVMLAIAAWIGWRSHAGTSAAPAAVQDAAHPGEAATAAPAHPAGSRPLPATAPLPASGTPLRLVFDDLKRRADNGEAPAACRLAAELEACEQVREELPMFEEQLRSHEAAMSDGHDPQPDPQQRRQFADAMERHGKVLLGRLEQCDGVPRVGPAERAGYWRRAALAGHLPALSHYAVGNAFRLQDTLRLLPQLQVYRDEAERLALQAAAAGDVRTTLALAAAYSSQPGYGIRPPFLAQVVAADPVRALALYLHVQDALAATGDARLLALRNVQERNLERLRAGMDAQQQSQARALAGQWRGQWQPPDLSAPLPRLLVYGNGGVADIGPDDCAR